MRKFIADSFASVIFSIVIGMVVEIGVTGLTVEQSIHCRLESIPIKLAQGRPYGWYRDWVTPWFGEVFAYTSFQTPIYAVLLIINGADWFQVLVACATRVLVSQVTGRLYVPFLAHCRRLFHVQS